MALRSLEVCRKPYKEHSSSAPRTWRNAKLTSPIATNGLFAGGGLLGCWFITYLADKVGRKQSIQITATICIVAGALQAGSVHIAMFLVARFMMGFGAGMVNVITPLYQSEVSPPKSRGFMVGSHGFVLCIGYVSITDLAMTRHSNFSNRV